MVTVYDYTYEYWVSKIGVEVWRLLS
jgi:hypothetical protein